MKAVILAGGSGSLPGEEAGCVPKPMVEIGGKPVLWHVMKIYAHYGINDFVILGGYRVDSIRAYFLNYRARNCDMSINLRSGRVDWLTGVPDDWQVTILDTGLDSMTGGRLKRARHLLQDGPFCLTYGDRLADVNMPDLVARHLASQAWCTHTALGRPGPAGESRTGGTEATDSGMIDGGFFVCQSEIFDLIDGDGTAFEDEPVKRLIGHGKLGCYIHNGFWRSMDTPQDRHVLEGHWASGHAPWKVWPDTPGPGVAMLRRSA